MHTASDQIAQLFAAARQGDENAILAIVTRFEPELRIVARQRLAPALHPYLDSMDLVQSVQKSLLRGIRQQRFDITSQERLLGLLHVMLRRKVARQWRKHRRQIRLGTAATDGDELPPDPLALIPDNAAGPARQSMNHEQIERLLGKLDACDRELIQLRLEGRTTAEAARMMQLNPDVVRVRLSRLRRRLREMHFFDDTSNALANPVATDQNVMSDKPFPRG